jgi:outer membrane translocation and assembly module TamA
MTKLKIEHGSDAVSTKCYVITGNNKQQSICWEGGADYEAIRYLQKRIAELEAFKSAVIGWRENDWPEGFCRGTAELIVERAKETQPTEEQS